MTLGREDNDSSRSIRRRLVAAVFPELRYGDDPDLDRYLELRRDGRVADALAVYNGALRARYPEDGERALLIALKRSRDPRWIELQSRLLDKLAGKLEQRVTANASIIVKAISAAGSRDAWGSLGAVDSLLTRLGAQDSPDSAIASVEGHLRLIRILGEADSQMAGMLLGLERAKRLLEEFASLSNFESPEAQDFVARSRALEEKKRATTKARGRAAVLEESTDFIARSHARKESEKRGRQAEDHFFNLDRIRFSSSEIAAIELANPPTRHEDVVIAWCAKYWRSALDPRFERTIFLYSGKYRTRHFEIYHELRSSRLRKRSDDEILTAMSSLLATGYSYSVTGDIYMQRRWMAVKAGLFEAEQASETKALASSAKAPAQAQEPFAEAQLVQASPGPTSPDRTQRKPSPAPAPESVAKRPSPGRSMVAESPLRPSREATTSPSRASAYRADALPDRARQKNRPEATPRAGKALLTKVPRGSRAMGLPKQAAEPVRALARGAAGSISDHIRRLSGRKYDVYKNIFLERVRDSIHRLLLEARTRQTGIFDTRANEAEDIVFAYIAAHYEDPFMDWESSRERGLVESLGFALPKLDTIIEDCYRRL
ncbi:MAG TPA: hypothetical protein VMV44_09280 [Rectinemataceae bacterium]|nr:hypothetical protein [Rectinemataceae bacterium]